MPVPGTLIGAFVQSLRSNFSTVLNEFRGGSSRRSVDSAGLRRAVRREEEQLGRPAAFTLISSDWRSPRGGRSYWDVYCGGAALTCGAGAELPASLPYRISP